MQSLHTTDLLLLDLRALKALHAISAFLHHPSHPNRHIGVALQMRSLSDLLLTERPLVEVVSDKRITLVVVEIIEASRFVGAVVRTIPSPDTAVVGHCVQPLLAVHGCIHRTNGLAGSILALHAGHRLRNHLGVLLNPVRGRNFLVSLFVHLGHR